jgi:hypothetical protein
MKTMVETKIIMAATLLAVVLPANGAAAEKDHGVPVAATVPGTPFEVSRNVSSLLDTYCFSCHDEETRKGDLRLDNLETMPLEARLDLMNRMQEQIFLREMPPKKKKQPEEVERDLLSAWLSGELRAHNASKLEDKLRKPEFGNVVDHDKLFSGKYKDLPAFTPDRRWLISEFIFEDKINRIMGLSTARGIDGKRRPVVGYNHRNGVSLTNPFLLPAHSGVRYYDTTILDGGHLQTMIGNAREISSYLLSQSKRNNSLLPAFNKLMAAEWEHEKVLAARESYLKSRIEPLLRELFMDRHAAMLPKFVPQPAQPVATVGPDGKPLPRPNFHEAAPSREDVNEIWAAMRRNSTPGDNDEALITKCEREWFVYGVNERTLQIRLEFMRGYMEHLHKDMPKQVEAAPPPPADSELIIIRHALQQHRKEGDTYSAIIAKCVAGWADEFAQIRRKANPFTEPLISELVEQIFTRIMERAPSEQEKSEYISLTMSYAEKQGSEKAVDRLIQSIMLRSDFVYRSEFGVGEADAHGRRLLPPRDASYAIAYALTDSSPDKGLTEAAASGRLNTREDYRREVERLLQAREPFYIVDAAVDSTHVDNITDLPIRKLRFFREFFGYSRLLAIFKDNKRFGGDYNPTTTARLVAEADMIVEHILKKDQNVFESLLTTEEFFVYHSGDNQAMSATVENISQVYEYFKDKDWKNFNAEQLKAHLPFLKEHPIPRVELDLIGSGGPRAQGSLDSFKLTMASFHERLGNGQTAAVPFSSFYGAPDHAKTRSRIEAMRGEQVAKFYGLNLVNWNYPAVQPAKMEHRKGMLTHPAWLIAFAGNTATDPIRRGKWVREKLLAGTVPDVPITVDAVIPEDHHKTLRQRLDKVTQAEYCWKCHERMNPLGTTFEIYDDFGRYRTEESLEHPDNLVKKIPAERGAPQDDLRHIYKTLPVNATGRLEGTGDSKLDGDIRDAIDLTGRLAKSTRVRQSIIRHAFRYFMGRNEVLSDSKTLIDADQAYVQSGGSFDAVIISLLTSDSFIYRKTTTD